MKITRGGEQIELTRKELIDAYYEMQHTWDVEYISGNLLDQYADDEFTEEISEAFNDKDLLDKVAYQYREFFEDCHGADDEMNCLIAAFNYMNALKGVYNR